MSAYIHKYHDIYLFEIQRNFTNYILNKQYAPIHAYTAMYNVVKHREANRIKKKITNTINILKILNNIIYSIIYCHAMRRTLPEYKLVKVNKYRFNSVKYYSNFTEQYVIVYEIPFTLQLCEGFL